MLLQSSKSDRDICGCAQDLRQAASLMQQPEVAYHNLYHVNAACAAPLQALLDYSTAITLEEQASS